MPDSQPATSLDVSGRYLGDQGQEYFEYQKQNVDMGGLINARLFQPFIKPTDTVLDFGCGSGTILLNLTAGKKIGIEPNPAARAYCANASKGTISAHAAIEEIPDQCVDVAISNHCLEHVPNVVAILRQLFRVLKPGGKIIVFVPIDDWRTQRAYDAKDINHHLHTWSPLLFGHTMAEGGFINIQTIVYTRAFPPKYATLFKRLPNWMFESICWLAAVTKKRRQVRAIAQRP